ncbi:MAG: hypothetical protein ACI8QZ_001954 [Chlamydiales bacterium]|jgi:hypothetical protein
MISGSVSGAALPVAWGVEAGAAGAAQESSKQEAARREYMAQV